MAILLPPQLKWSKERTYCIGADAGEWSILDEVKLLDRHKYKSVEDAVTALNRGQIPCLDFCIVFSMSRQAFYLLWPCGKTDADVTDLAARVKSGAAKAKIASSGVSQVQVSTVSMPVAVSDVLQAYTQPASGCASMTSTTSTTDTTPTNTPPQKEVPVTTPDKLQSPPKTPLSARGSPTQGYRWVGTEAKPTVPKASEVSSPPTSVRSLPQGSANVPLGQGSTKFPLGQGSPKLPLGQASAKVSVPPPRCLPARTLQQQKATLLHSASSDKLEVRPRRCLPAPGKAQGGPTICDRPTDLDEPIVRPRSATTGAASNQPRLQPPRSFPIGPPSVTTKGALARAPLKTGSLTGSLTPRILASVKDAMSCGSQQDSKDSAPQDAPLKTGLNLKGTSSHTATTKTPNTTATSTPATAPKASAPSVTGTATPSDAPVVDGEEANPPGMMCIAFPDVEKMTVEELRMGSSDFDPLNPQTRLQLLEKLGFAKNSTIELSQDNSGSFNYGVWNLYNSTTHGLCLKLVESTRRHPARLTDSEKCQKLAAMCQRIVNEFTLSFPVKIFELRAPSGARCKHDLIVMRRAAGIQLTQILYHKWHANQRDELLRMFNEFGSFMHTMHRVYKGMQHGDCQPSNVFYDLINGYFTLIDVADMGYGPFVADGGENDVEHFVKGLKTLTKWYSQQFIADAERQFRAGYAEAEKLRPRAVTNP